MIVEPECKQEIQNRKNFDYAEPCYDLLAFLHNTNDPDLITLRNPCSSISAVLW